MTAVEWFVKGMRERGVEWIATLCGHGLDPLYHAAKRAGLRLVDTRNEQTAGYIAECFGRLTRSPGVCAVSSGVAHANALSGVLNAHLDGSPMLLVSGAGALRTAGMGHFQDCDQVALARPSTKYARIIDCADRAVQILDEAWRAAAGPPPGPVHLTFPMDVQNEEVGENRLIPSVSWSAPGVAADDPEEIARTLARAHQPLIVAGSGVFYAGGSDDMLRFSERYSIPVVVPIWDRGSVNRPAPTFMGVLGAATGGPRLLPDADFILMAGAVCDYRVGFLQPEAVRPDARIFFFERGWKDLDAACALHSVSGSGAWIEEARRRRDHFRHLVVESALRQAEKGTHAIHILGALRGALTDETELLIDGGSIGQWAHQLLCDRYPGHWLTCGRSGVVGWGIGGAMAARLAYPNRPVILLSGDGAFTFNVAEIECAVRQKLHFVVIVADDQGWGITRVGHIRQFGEPIASELGPIAIDKLAEALGAHGVRIDRPEHIGPALVKALAEPAVSVLHVPITGGNP